MSVGSMKFLLALKSCIMSDASACVIVAVVLRPISALFLVHFM